jgi:hypothetical protein
MARHGLARRGATACCIWGLTCNRTWHGLRPEPSVGKDDSIERPVCCTWTATLMTPAHAPPRLSSLCAPICLELSLGRHARWIKSECSTPARYTVRHHSPPHVHLHTKPLARPTAVLGVRCCLLAHADARAVRARERQRMWGRELGPNGFGTRHALISQVKRPTSKSNEPHRIWTRSAGQVHHQLPD